MNKNDISFYTDEEVHGRLRGIQSNPMMQVLLNYTFPNKQPEEIAAVLDACRSTRDFQAKIIYPALQRLLRETSDGLSTGGFDRLEADRPYLYISNHRDIVLDTSLTNFVLLEKDLVMTASAIGDNLVKNDFLLQFAKINRNFLVRRGLSPRETLMSSKHLSQFIEGLILRDHRSVWIAQREGRAKNGNDTTHQGVLKMLSLAKDRNEKGLCQIQKLNLLPLSISYELDPTDHLKVKELLAAEQGIPYEKEEGEDFQSILAGFLGQKKRIHIQAGEMLNEQIRAIALSEEPEAKQFQELSQLIDREIQTNYRLWPTNYIAYDELFQVEKYAGFYTAAERKAFLERMESRLEKIEEPKARSLFLQMYANPVLNKRREERLK